MESMTGDSRDITQEETIAAISTPIGEGGIGTVRLSGESAIDILKQMFTGPSGKQRESFDSHRVYYGYIVDSDSRRLDETLVTPMLSPKTYTREDVVEISCHGGASTLRSVLQRTLELGARMAEPGEFSKRAFINGRIDLLQAEAIIDLIKSKSDKGWKTAFSQLDGKLSERLHEMESELVGIISNIEASIDFPDEEIEIVDNESLRNSLQLLHDNIALLSKSYGIGRIYREGVSIAITGRPNVGKSSLMNALLERDRVIVTPYPGTTRDTVEETLHLEGIAVKIIDTAGVRETAETAEKIGVQRALLAASQADVTLLVVDGSAPLAPEDFKLLETLKSNRATGGLLIPVINKSDKPLVIDTSGISDRLSAATSNISAKTGDGVETLRRRIANEIIIHGEPAGDGPVLTRERHKEKLDEMSGSVKRAVTALGNGMSREFIAADLADAKRAMEELTGKTIDDQVITRIFDEFCIGK